MEMKADRIAAERSATLALIVVADQPADGKHVLTKCEALAAWLLFGLASLIRGEPPAPVDLPPVAQAARPAPRSLAEVVARVYAVDVGRTAKRLELQRQADRRALSRGLAWFAVLVVVAAWPGIAPDLRTCFCALKGNP